MKNKAEQIIQSISEQLKTLSEVIQKDSLKKTSRKRRVENRITIVDERDGNQYRFVKIGNLYWCTENLRYLPEVSEDESEDEPRYYVYGYEGDDVDEAKNTNKYSQYGALYNWPAAMEACPPGTRLPTDEEWKELVSHYGGDTVAGNILKTEEFNTLMGVYGSIGGSFFLLGFRAYFWSSSEPSSANAWRRYLSSSETGVNRNANNKGHGFSVRCVINIK